VISGGAGGRIKEADLMRELAEALGVPGERIITEAESRSTRESAALVARRVRPLDVDAVHLVTSALHMPRAAWAFSANGLEACRHPVDWRQVRFELPGGLVPQITALEKSTRAVREVAGLVWYRLSYARCCSYQAIDSSSP
jgi:uncharacterized SAM-binding protein YcdF (DUF218 family)